MKKQFDRNRFNWSQVCGPLVQRLKYASWESQDTVLSENSRRAWHERRYKGTWWHLDDKLDMGVRILSGVRTWSWRLEPGDIECLPAALGTQLESWPWYPDPNPDIKALWYLTFDSHSSLTYYAVPLTYFATGALTSQCPEPTRLLPNSKCGINAICLTSSSSMWLIQILSRLQFTCCFLCPHPQTRAKILQ